MVSPTLFEIIFFAVVSSLFVTTMYYFYKTGRGIPSLPVIAIFGFLLIISTNFIHGWFIGIYSAIGSSNEILTDAMAITNPLEFISMYVENQGSLTTHAQTQPPFAVLTMHLFYVVFQEPGVIAIALCGVATLFSAFFIDGIYRKYFGEETSRYAVLLFLVLPAVQVYYLANIYAMVATYAAGMLYFYLQDDQFTKILGSAVCFILGSFTSFLFVYMALFLFLFEVVHYLKTRTPSSFLEQFQSFMHSIWKLIAIGIIGGVFYILLWLGLGFNYVDSFLHASSVENPNGFMLVDNPLNYLITRVQDVMDILVFVGPILTVLAVLGFHMWNEMDQDTDVIEILSIFVASVIALGLLFLTGAPKKGETARICMFILPMILLPVIYYLKEKNVRKRDWILLLIMTFLQAATMQLLAIWVW
ncbi:MAG: hypothetical protein GF411_03710 [Candidatus Lokiarchaeota archaeon]|nr:hypothetical protein [Candidatus Lokiarchaeota archaeon]